MRAPKDIHKDTDMLTDATIRAAEREARQTKTLVVLIDDTGQRGVGRLVLRFRPRSDGGVTGEWIAKRKQNGQRASRVIGRWPDLTLAKARATFMEVRDQIAVKVEPDAPRLGTVAELFTGYVESLRRDGKGWDEPERILLTARNGPLADAIGREKPARDVTPTDVTDALRPVFERGPSIAKHARAFAAAAFNWGLRAEHDYRQSCGDRARFGLTGNPVAALVSIPGVKRDRVLTADELRRWWHEFPHFARPVIVQVLRLSFMACARPTEAMAAEPDALRGDTWAKPKTKNGRPHRAPLIGLAAEAAKALADLGGAAGLDIPAIGKANRRWATRAGVPLFQARDLRRTARTWLEESGEDPALLDIAFNHSTVRGGVVGSYVHAERWQDRISLAERWDAMIRAVIEK